MQNSLWEQNVKLPEFPKLKDDIKTDVLIIGGGMAGLLCAYRLEQNGVDYILAEQNKIASGVTKNTTAKITVQHGYIYSDISKRYGEKAARQYFKANNRAVEQYKEICKNIDCDFEECDSVVFSRDNKKTAKELATLNKIGVAAEFLSETDLPLKIAGAIKIKNQAQFNPLKFIANISRGLKIYENTKITGYDGKNYFYDGGKITAKSTIVATHFPIFNKHGLYPLKMYQHRSYVLALENTKQINGMYVDENLLGLSFRNYGDTLLLGGGSHRTGKNGGGFNELRDFAKRYLGPVKIKSEWATQDCMTLDNIAYIGKYSKNTPDMFVAAGFNKWGMTLSLVAANVLVDLIMGKENEFADLFSPARSILHPQLAVNAVETTINLITPTSPRCPHLGCALKWNREEHSWDCACHGSRFGKDGRVLNNPATDDLGFRG